MNDYRPLTSEEIEALQHNGCWAEDWTSVNVAEDFTTEHMRQVTIYGEVNIGSFDKNIEVSPGFMKHTGIRNATLHNVTIGDDCLIENIGTFISNYTIGDECYICNVATIETTEGASYGEANTISVLNEAGEGNIMLYSDLSSQMAALMVRHSSDQQARERIFQLVRKDVSHRMPERGLIGNNVKITNTKEITNCIVNDYCEVSGAERLNDCTLLGDASCSVYIGTGVVAENCIIDYGASITNGANLQDCFVGEACQISNGFSASASVFFANSVMSNGEACAAFCGPFSASHHKSSLLIGGQFSFYNAGSSTNFSNHAYKMGPIHWGILQRGTKTASGSYLFMPAHIGAYSVCLGKMMSHPDTHLFPFSYVFGEGEKTILIPGKNLTTVGFYRDINKWPKRDLRPQEHRKSLINQDWLSPFVVQQMIEGRRILKALANTCGKDCTEYQYHGLTIPGKSLARGISYYDSAINMFLGQALQEAEKLRGDGEAEGLQAYGEAEEPQGIGVGNASQASQLTAWSDLSGLLLTQRQEDDIMQALKADQYEDISQLADALEQAHAEYKARKQDFAQRLIQQLYADADNAEELNELILRNAKTATTRWTEDIKKDAKKEYLMGDVEEDTYQHFIKSIIQTI